MRLSMWLTACLLLLSMHVYSQEQCQKACRQGRQTPVCGGSLIKHCQKACRQGRQAFMVKEGLFDELDENSLGLDKAPGAETFVVFTPSDTTNHFCNGVVIAAFKDVLYCMWQTSATGEDTPDTYVRYSRSYDGGKTWERSEVLALCPDTTVFYTSGGWIVSGDSLVALINCWRTDTKPSGGSAWYMTSADGIHWSKGLSPQTTDSRLRRESDKTLSKGLSPQTTDLRPVLMADGSPMNGIIEQDPCRLADDKGSATGGTPDKHCLISLPPQTGRLVGAAHFQPGLHVSPIYTDDAMGVSGWKKAEIPHCDDLSNPQSRELEPSLFVKSDSTIVMVFRDQNSSFRKLASMSYDRGETWTEIQLTDMPDSRSKQCAGNLPDGTAFLVGNPVTNKSRQILALTLSADGNMFDRAFLLRGKDELAPRRYEGKAKTIGYNYPKAMVYNGFLYVGYSENKEKVCVTRIKVSTLGIEPRTPTMSR